METPSKPLDARRARSLDRSQAPRKGSDVGSCRCLSLPSMPGRRAPSRMAGDRARGSRSPASSAEAQGSAAAALALEDAEFLRSEQRPPQDSRKDKGQRRAQQGWLKAVLSFFLGPEEPREKGSRRPKGKEEPLEAPEAPGEPALRKKGHNKASRKKHGHKRHGAEETKGAQDHEAGGQEAGLPREAASSHLEETDTGPARRDEQSPEVAGSHPLVPVYTSGARESDLHPSLPIQEGAGAGSEEGPTQPDQDAAIRMIVELLKKVGDQWEEEHQAPPLGMALQIPAPAYRRKSQEKKASLQRAFSLKKFGPEEPRKAGPAEDSSPEPRPPKRPSFLPLCIASRPSSTPSSPGLEEEETCKALSADSEGPSPSAPPTQAGPQGPREELLDRASEFNKFIQKILALLQDAEKQEGEQQPPAQEAEVAVENPAPVCRKKSRERKSSLRRAFSQKRHSAKGPRKTGPPGPEARPPKRPSALPLCVGGHRSSHSSISDPEGLELQEPTAAAEGGALGLPAPSQAGNHTSEGGPQPEGACESKELVICKLVALLQEMDGELGQQIRRHPSFRSFFYEFSDPSLRKLVATLRRQRTRSSLRDGRLTQSSFPLAMGLAQELAGNPGRTICSLMGSRGHYGQRSYAQPSITSPESLSPD